MKTSGGIFERGCAFRVWMLGWLLLFGGCGAAFAVGTYEESPVFAFDTRDSNGTHFASSALFAFDTRDSNSTHYAESAVFAFNTRGNDERGSRTSGGFSFDTRTIGLTTLTLAGPGHINTGGTGQFTCTANYTGLPPEDVTNTAAWTIAGGPPGTRITRGLVTAGTGPGGTARTTASVQRSNGQRTSVPFEVTIGAGLRVQIPPPVVTLMSRTGQSFQWRVQASRSLPVSRCGSISSSSVAERRTQS